MIRIALIGPGHIGQRHIAAIGASSEATLVAFVDSSPASRPQADKLQIPHFADTGAMLDTLAPDGVIVATPTEHHLEPALTALDAGAHVLVEKPVTETVAQARRLVSKSAEAGRHVLVGHHRRYYECVDRARDIVRGGEIGRLVAVIGQWTVRKHDEYYEESWRRRRAAGPVLTNLVHDMDCLRAICGEVESINGEITNGIEGYEKEDAAAIILRFANGALGTFLASDRASSPWGWEAGTGETPFYPRSGENSVRFVGTEGALDFPNLVLWKSAGKRADWKTPMTPTPIPTDIGDAFQAQISHFCEIIRGEALPRIPAADAAATLAATVAVFDAAGSGRRVVLQAEP